VSFVDKAKHKAEEVIGEIKEKVGGATGNRELEAEGQKDQVAGNVKQAGDSVKDAVSDIGKKLGKD
jgi:CsbD-like.